MAWEAQLGFNAEVQEATRTAIEELTVDELALAIANDKYSMFGAYSPKHDAIFDRWVTEAKQLTHDVLVDECYRRACRTDTSDNGGGVIWIDKGGCSKVVLA